MGHHSGPKPAPDCSIACALEGVRRDQRYEQASPAHGGNCGACARDVIVAPSDAEAEERMFGANTANRCSSAYLGSAVQARPAGSAPSSRAPDDDEERRPDVLMKGVRDLRLADAVLDKLVAFRDRVGPFGAVLKMGVELGEHQQSIGSARR